MKILEKARLRFVWMLVGVAATAAGVIVWASLPAWPVIGVAAATLVVALNSITNRLDKDRCLGCGQGLRNAVYGEHGCVCPNCQQLNPPTHSHLAKVDRERTLDLLNANERVG